MSADLTHVVLTVQADAHLARLVRMTAANVATLSSCSLERVEDVKMVAEEAFIYACSAVAGSELSINFDATAEQVDMVFELGVDEFEAGDEDGQAAVYAELIIGAVCDAYEKRAHPAALAMTVKADL